MELDDKETPRLWPGFFKKLAFGSGIGIVLETSLPTMANTELLDFVFFKLGRSLGKSFKLVAELKGLFNSLVGVVFPEVTGEFCFNVEVTLTGKSLHPGNWTVLISCRAMLASNCLTTAISLK